MRGVDQKVMRGVGKSVMNNGYSHKVSKAKSGKEEQHRQLQLAISHVVQRPLSIQHIMHCRHSILSGQHKQVINEWDSCENNMYMYIHIP